MRQSSSSGPRHSGVPDSGLSRSLPQILRSLDIRVVLTGLEVWTGRDRSLITPDANATLWAFLQWRRGLWTRRPHDSTQLLTWVSFWHTRVAGWPLLSVPPSHALLRHLQGSHLSGHHGGLGACGGHVPRRELRRCEHSKLRRGPRRGGAWAGLVVLSEARLPRTTRNSPSAQQPPWPTR